MIDHGISAVFFWSFQTIAFASCTVSTGSITTLSLAILAKPQDATGDSFTMQKILVFSIILMDVIDSVSLHYYYSYSLL